MNKDDCPGFELSDPWVGERVIEPGALAIVKDQLKVLKHFRDDGRVPSQHLLDDIAVYEFIIAHPYPDLAASQYMRAMAHERARLGETSRKLRVAQKLGWFQ